MSTPSRRPDGRGRPNTHIRGSTPEQDFRGPETQRKPGRIPQEGVVRHAGRQEVGEHSKMTYTYVAAPVYGNS